MRFDEIRDKVSLQLLETQGMNGWALGHCLPSHPFRFTHKQTRMHAEAWRSSWHRRLHEE